MDRFYLYSFPTTIGVALLVIAGCYGNGEERVKRLEADGYDYNVIQDCVNDLLSLMDKYGD